MNFTQAISARYCISTIRRYLLPPTLNTTRLLPQMLALAYLAGVNFPGRPGQLAPTKRGQRTALVVGAVGQFAAQGLVGFVDEFVEASHSPPCRRARADWAQRRISRRPTRAGTSKLPSAYAAWGIASVSMTAGTYQSSSIAGQCSPRPQSTISTRSQSSSDAAASRVENERGT